jgi:hypothetical protein
MIGAKARISQYRKTSECKASSYDGRRTTTVSRIQSKKDAAVEYRFVEDNCPNESAAS